MLPNYIGLCGIVYQAEYQHCFSMYVVVWVGSTGGSSVLTPPATLPGTCLDETIFPNVNKGRYEDRRKETTEREKEMSKEGIMKERQEDVRKKGERKR
jgi:hypothetical protein